MERRSLKGEEDYEYGLKKNLKRDSQKEMQ